MAMSIVLLYHVSPNVCGIGLSILRSHTLTPKYYFMENSLAILELSLTLFPVRNWIVRRG